eukprot:2629351-Rhodomonas_salina.3
MVRLSSTDTPLVLVPGSLVSPPGTVLDEPITGGGYKDVVTANEQLYAKANVELDENHSVCSAPKSPTKT